MSESKHTPGPLDTKPDNPTVQQCCICYGGNSFPGPMREALECHLSILSHKYPVLAAAPALLEALRAVRDTSGGYVFDRDEMPDDENPVIISSSTYKQVKAALAQAEKEVEK